MGEQTDYGKVRQVTRRLNDIGDAVLDIQYEYETDPSSSRQVYQNEIDEFLEEAETLTEPYGINELEEHDWVADADTPRVTMDRMDERRPAAEYRVELVAEAYNSLAQIREYAATFPNIDMPEDAEEASSEAYAHNVSAEDPVVLAEELQDQYDVETMAELTEQYLDAETGEPLYGSTSELEERINSIAANTRKKQEMPTP